MGVDETSLDRIRNATFPTTRRGYDKTEVEKFLGRLADWLETGAGDESRSDVVKRELEKVGQRTGAILAQAEESAQQIRAEAEDEVRGTINAANIQATETRSEAEKYASEARAAADVYAREIRDTVEQEAATARAEADRIARETIEAAETQARRIVEDGEHRREDLEAVIADLVRRRDDVLADTQELSARLTAAVGQHRPEPGSDPFSRPEQLDPLARGGGEGEPPAEQTAEVAETEAIDRPEAIEAIEDESTAEREADLRT
jgi:DivIVA domain-containing protein